MPRLSLRGIEKSFDTNVVLSGIDLDVYEGELVALLGENGAGKSTMSSIIAGLFPPSSRDDDVGGPTLCAHSAG